MRERGVGVLDACRSYDRETSTIWRSPRRNNDEREASALAIAQRYYRAKKRLLEPLPVR
jgi:hypothetical protein